MEDSRELTRQEKAAIRALVVKWCANYDRDYGCLPLECECYMLGKCWTGAYCRYFHEAVLPLDPGLEASLTTPIPALELRICPVCGRSFPPKRQQRYCSPTCQAEANRKKEQTADAEQAAQALRLEPEKGPVFKGFPARFYRGWYHFIPHPCFGETIQTFCWGSGTKCPEAPAY